MLTAQEYIIDTIGLSKTYKGVNALQPLDLQVKRNTICGFLGPNGAGKSTTIKLLLGLARPTTGTGTIFGYDIVKDSTEIRRRVGYLAQDPRFYDHMTARETLRFTAHFFYSGPSAAIERRIEETLELVGLSEKADRAIRGFSGGERQRLGIAQAPISELMSGRNGIHYSLTVQGNGMAVQERLAMQPWVSNVSIMASNGSISMQVQVINEKAAEANLLRIVLTDPHTTVTEFGRKKHNLEDIFMEIVSGDKPHDNSN